MMAFGKNNRTSALWCWGRIRFPKGGENPNGPFWNPLAVELLTAGSVMSERWETFPPRQSKALTSVLDLPDQDTARLVWSFLAGVSRVGEANPGRMNGFGGELPDPRWVEARHTWHEAAILARLPLYPLTDHFVGAEPEYVTAATLPRLLGCDCSDVKNGEECRDHRALAITARALNLSKGHALHAEFVNRAKKAADDRWNGVRSALVELVADHVGIDRESLPALIRATRTSEMSSVGALLSRINREAGEAIDRGGFSEPTETSETLSARAHELAGEARGRSLLL